MTIESELYDFLKTTLLLDEDKFFVSRMPDIEIVKDGWWLIYAGGEVESQFLTSSKTKLHSFILYYRNQRSQVVDEEISKAEQILNHLKCVSLPSYRILSLRAQSFNSNEDSDSVGYYKGSLTIRIEELDNYE